MTTLTESEDRITRLEDGLTAVRSELADVRVEVERVRVEIALMEARLIRWMVGTLIGSVAATAALFASAVAILKLLGG